MKFNGPALMAVGVGGLLTYSGIRGFTLSRAVLDLVQGSSPASGQATQNISVPSGGSFAGGGGDLAGNMGNVIGHPYKFGGAPGISGTNPWDCSSCVNWVANKMTGLPIPGYKANAYTGTSHGPPTTVWLVWTGLSTVGHNASQAQPGDLCIWQTHMGVCIGPNQMISAENPSKGTQKSVIQGAIPGEVLFVRRYK